MNIEYEARRERVEQLLKKCTCKKLLRGGTAIAIGYAREAYKCSTLEPALPTPWPELAAYRLAHLVLRQAPDPEQLQEADILFAEASGRADDNVPLGPMPRLYRLAVLHRLSCQGVSVNPETPKTVLQRAREAVNRWPSSRDESSEHESKPHRQSPIQDGLINMLELAFYFLGEKYEPLEGLSGPYSDLMLGPDAWMLVGPDPIISRIKMPKELAFAELEDRGRALPDSVLFRLLSREHAEWRLASKPPWEPANADEILLLTLLLKKQSLRTEELRLRVAGADGKGSKDRFRQIKRRLKMKLGTLTGQKIDVVPPPVAAGPMIYGAVHYESAYPRRNRAGSRP